MLPILPSAIGDAFVSAEHVNEPQDVYPLDVYQCRDCGHLQNLDIVDPQVLFRIYTYRTAVSLGLVEHFRQYAKAVTTDLAVPANSLVVEIGSNDGSLLKAFKSLGMRVLGIDPARDIAQTASQEGIPTIPEFFNSALARQISAEHGKATLFCANNVFAHIDNLSDVVAGIREVLAPDGVFIFEVSYVPDMVERMLFDTIYHEHVSYHALMPLERFLNRHDMTLFDCARVPTKGGSIRGFAQIRSIGRRAVTDRLKAMFAEEKRLGVTEPAMYRAYSQAIEDRKQAVLHYLDEAIASGASVAGFGASTTTTTLLYHFELGPRLSFIVDDNPIKHRTFSPGYHIPVLPSSELLVRRPDIVVILAWMYSDPIVKKNGAYLEGGGRLLIPLPDMRIVQA